MNASTQFRISGHVFIRDKHSHEVLYDGHNAIHYGNMGYLIAHCLAGDTKSHINYMAFGNGGTGIDSTGKVIYKTPRVSESHETGANMYNRTYYKNLYQTGSTANNMLVVPGPSYTDVMMTCTLGHGEPQDQDLFDSSTDNQGDYVFDEMALYSAPREVGDINTSAMMAHVIFHPVQKSQNRVIEIVYTVRVQLS